MSHLSIMTGLCYSRCLVTPCCSSASIGATLIIMLLFHYASGCVKKKKKQKWGICATLDFFSEISSECDNDSFSGCDQLTWEMAWSCVKNYIKILDSGTLWNQRYFPAKSLTYHCDLASIESTLIQWK